MAFVHIHSAGRGLFEDTRFRIQEVPESMSELKSNVKGLLNQRVRVGLLTVPLWVVGALFLARRLRDRRR